ncbi:MAG: hypothetical protein M4579_007166 [Chaenotheca gracillima]|nr:MAG: hypothetical protein M4579_007166 [Chaenotheca gracillima]
MAATIPAGLKPADITRFAVRAAQLEKVKPVIAYWCDYYIVNQILSKGLHKTDTESTHYTTSMMDKLEAIKTQHPGEDAIVDDVAAQAYVEQFGLDTFQRADNAVKANQVTRQTADTFQAAATFLDLCHIWGVPEGEIAAKIKFAKFHALRIAKALKAGEDPNLSNPVQEPEGPPEEALDPDDPEVQMLDSPPSGAGNKEKPRQPSVVEVPDENDRIQRSLAAKSNLDESLHPSRASSVPRQPNQQPQIPSPPNKPVRPSYTDDVSPLAPSPDDRNPSSGGGGYFPDVPTFTSETSASNLPTAPPDPPAEAPPMSPPGPSIAQPPTAPSFYSPQAPDPSARAPQFSPPPPAAPPQDYYRTQQPTAPPAVSVQQPYQSGPPRGGRDGNFNADEEAVLKAQKHARWAISALNFEDVKTAVKELRGALDALGAT